MSLILFQSFIIKNAYFCCNNDAVNPVISYKDKGKTKHTTMVNRDKISKNKNLILESNDNMCDNYVNILKNFSNKGRSNY